MRVDSRDTFYTIGTSNTIDEGSYVRESAFDINTFQKQMSSKLLTNNKSDVDNLTAVPHTNLNLFKQSNDTDGINKSDENSVKFFTENSYPPTDDERSRHTSINEGNSKSKLRNLVDMLVDQNDLATTQNLNLLESQDKTS